MKRYLLAFLIFGCTPIEVPQLAKVAHDVAVYIHDYGCEPRSDRSEILLDSTEAVAEWEGKPPEPLPIDVENPDSSDKKIVKVAAKALIRKAKKRNLIRNLILAALGIGTAGGAIWKGKGILSFLTSGGKIKGLAKAFITALNEVKSIVPQRLQAEVGKIARNAARKQRVKSEVDVAYEHEREEKA